MAKLIPAPPPSGGGGTTTVTFNTSQSWVAPAGVTNLITASGKGQDGTPLIPGSPGTPISRSATIDSISTTTTSQSEVGRFYWQYLQDDAPNAVSILNAGGTGSVFNTILLVKPAATINLASYSVEQVAVPFTNVVPGSASYTYNSGWQTTGAISTSGSASVFWQEYGTGSADTPATTGANTTGFGKTWNGGVGIAAVGTSYNNVTVIPGTSYPLVIAPGGFITITY